METRLLEMEKALTAVQHGSLKTEDVINWIKEKSFLILISIIVVPDIRWLALLLLFGHWLQLF